MAKRHLLPAAVAAAGLLLGVAPGANGQEGHGPAPVRPAPKAAPPPPVDPAQPGWNGESGAATALSKEKLLESLRAMKRQPKDIEVQCAMCYKTAGPPADTPLTCDACSKTCQLSLRQGPGGSEPDAGWLSRELDGLDTGFRRLDPAARIDTRGLCPTCRPNGPVEVVVTYACAGCRQPLTLTLTNAGQARYCAWLFLDLPVKTLDGNSLGLWGRNDDNGPGIASGALYIYEHRFCPACRAKNPLTP